MLYYIILECHQRVYVFVFIFTAIKPVSGRPIQIGLDLKPVKVVECFMYDICVTYQFTVITIIHITTLTIRAVDLH